MPHLDAAYNLARWLLRHEQDAEDAVQEAFLRAFQFFGGFQGETGRAWLMQIVRNTCYTWLARNKGAPSAAAVDQAHELASAEPNPRDCLEQREDRELLLRAIGELPVEFREALVLRELEGRSYKEIARIASVPLGTVMSRLARARAQLHDRLAATEQNERPT